MLEQIREFVSKNQMVTAIGAALGAIALYAAYDSSTRQAAPTVNVGGGGAGGGGSAGGLPLTPTSTGGAHEVIDQHGFDRPVRALTINVPNGWQVQSGIHWDNINGQCSTHIASPKIQMRSGDGREQIDILPGYLVTTDSSMITNRGSQPGDFCIIAQIETGEAMLQAIVQRMRPGARIESINSVPLTPAQQTQQQQLQGLAQSGGGQMRATVYSLEAWIRHNDGSAEVIAIDGYVFASPPMIAGVPPLVFNANNGVISVRTSPDRLPALLQTARQIIAGAQFDPSWRSQIEEMQRRVSAPAGSRGGGPVARGGGGGGGFDMDQWRRDQRRDDRAQRDRIDAIREVERCYDPETGTVVEVSIHVGC